MKNLDIKIEAILFFKGEPVSINDLSIILKKSEKEVMDSLDILEERLKNGGINLLRNDNNVTLGTTPEAGMLIEQITKEELSKDLGKAGLETLSIILYRGPVTRAQVDYIRGVNSTFIIRNLLIRGLIEKVPNPEDQRSYLYKPTFELLSYLGITKIEDLPEYNQAKNEIVNFESELIKNNKVIGNESIENHEIADE